MIVDRLDLTPAEIERALGWRITPEGACKDDRCVPLDGPADLRRPEPVGRGSVLHLLTLPAGGPAPPASQRDPNCS